MIELIAQSIVFLFVFFFLYRKDQDERVGSQIMMQSYADMIRSTTEKFIQELSKIEQKHFEQIEKQSSKQLQILERQTKDYMEGISSLAEALQPKPQRIIAPDLLDNSSKIENSIEKEELPETNLADMPRIPIVNGVNIQFEGEEEIFEFHPE